MTDGRDEEEIEEDPYLSRSFLMQIHPVSAFLIEFSRDFWEEFGLTKLQYAFERKSLPTVSSLKILGLSELGQSSYETSDIYSENLMFPRCEMKV